MSSPLQRRVSSLLQISDPHFGTESPQLLAAIRALHAQLAPELVVVSGDITQRATRRQFRAARAFLSSLNPKSVLTLPGNHDVPLFNLALRAFDPYRRYRVEFGGELEPVHDSQTLLVVGVNTVRPCRHSTGAVSIEQIRQVAQRLSTARPKQLRVVVTHHPVAVVRPEDAQQRLARAEAAIPVWVAAGLDLILGGHIHLPYLIPLSSGAAGLKREAWLAQAGTACSRRTRGAVPNSLTVVHSSSCGHCSTIERWDYQASAQAFQLAATRTVTLSRP